MSSRPSRRADGEAALRYAAEQLRELFDGRTGHGGGPCTSRVLTRKQLAVLVGRAFIAGQRAAGAVIPAPDWSPADGQPPRYGATKGGA